MERVRPGIIIIKLINLMKQNGKLLSKTSHGFPPMSPGGSGLVGSIAPGMGGLKPLKTPGGGMPSGKG